MDRLGSTNLREAHTDYRIHLIQLFAYPAISILLTHSVAVSPRRPRPDPTSPEYGGSLHSTTRIQYLVKPQPFRTALQICNLRRDSSTILNIFPPFHTDHSLKAHLSYILLIGILNTRPPIALRPPNPPLFVETGESGNLGDGWMRGYLTSGKRWISKRQRSMLESCDILKRETGEGNA